MFKKALDKLYKLTIEDTDAILRKYIEPRWHIKYSIRQSDQSDSIYVTFYGDNAEKIVRLSDHPGKYLTYHYISKRTKIKKVVGIFNNSIKCLNTLCVNKRLQEVEYE